MHTAPQPGSPAPVWTRAEDGREIIPIKSLLEWAFGTECARLDFDEVSASAGGSGIGPCATKRIIDQLELGLERGAGVRVDTSIGRSYPHDDAEIIATMVRNVLPWYRAVAVAELARSFRMPDAMVGVVPHLQPAEWVCNRHGWRGRKADAAALGGDGWQHVRRRNRKGVLVAVKVEYTPCAWVPDAKSIAAARRAYLDWWNDLLTIRAHLAGTDLTRWHISEKMPAMKPWSDVGVVMQRLLVRARNRHADSY